MYYILVHLCFLTIKVSFTDFKRHSNYCDLFQYEFSSYYRTDYSIENKIYDHLI